MAAAEVGRDRCLPSHYTFIHHLTQSRHCTDIVEERSTDGRCGWAFCSRELRAGGPTGLRIAYREKRVYEVKNSSLFCCGSCLEKAMLFQVCRRTGLYAHRRAAKFAR